MTPVPKSERKSQTIPTQPMKLTSRTRYPQPPPLFQRDCRPTVNHVDSPTDR